MSITTLTLPLTLRDECAFDRSTAMRTKAAMGDGSLIDLHSDDGQFVRSPANGYMSLMPYIDSLWFGEGYDYDEPPEYWLIEVSGLAFGLMGGAACQKQPRRAPWIGASGPPRG